MGLYAIIFDETGRLLIKRRQPGESLPGDWDLPGGSFDLDEADRACDERAIGKALSREVFEETGIKIDEWDIEHMPAMYPALIMGGMDVAYIVNIGRYDEKPTIGEWRYVTTKELLVLCVHPQGDRLVSGFGKRMCRLCLKGLTFSKDAESAALARRMLAECYQ